MKASVNFHIILKTVKQYGFSFVLALLIAEIWFELHSFSLELGCFSATWFAIDFAMSRVSKVFKNFMERSSRKLVAPPHSHPKHQGVSLLSGAVALTKGDHSAIKA